MSDSLASNLIQENFNKKKKFNQKYEVIQRLGKGSIGDVCLVRLREAKIGGSAFDAEGEKFKIGGLTFHFIDKKKINKIKEKFESLNCKPKFDDAVITSATGDAPSDASTSSRRKSGVKDLAEIDRRKYEMIYALKTIQINLIDDKSLLDELRNEIDILKSMDHPNIVKAHEIYYHKDEQIYIVMECCSGGDLHARAPYSEAMAKRISKQLLSAINYMHDHGIVHRDLKFENIMFENTHKDAIIKVIDFGLSKKFIASQSHKKTIMTNFCGSLYTMSPQVISQVGYTSKADLWSCGVIIYILLVNKKPFLKKAKKQLVAQIMRGEYYDMDGNCKIDDYNELWSMISDEGKDLVKKLLVVEEFQRLDAAEALKHKWFQMQTAAEGEEPAEGEDPSRPRSSSTRAISVGTMKNIGNALLDFREASTLKRIALNVIAHNSTTEEIVKLRDIFAEYDTENDGIITIEELKQALKKCEFSDELMEEIFESVDVNENGHIMYTEFLAATLEVQGYIEEERIAEAFDIMDNKNTGFIDMEEISKLLGKSKCSKSEVKRILKEADENQDGKISYDEFLKLFRKEKSKTTFEVCKDSESEEE